MNCKYRYCGAGLPADTNGNRHYCDDYCSYEERLEREKERYNKKKSTLSEMTRIEGLLRACHNQYGESPFDVNILRSLGMNWTLYSSILHAEFGEIRIVGSLGYIVLENFTILILKF
jgi:hypothetical protein